MSGPTWFGRISPLVTILALPPSGPALAGVVTSVEKRVNPGSTAAPYDGFSESEFAEA